jgi:hypothetical protein
MLWLLVFILVVIIAVQQRKVRRQSNLIKLLARNNKALCDSCVHLKNLLYGRSVN